MVYPKVLFPPNFISKFPQASGQFSRSDQLCDACTLTGRVAILEGVLRRGSAMPGWWKKGQLAHLVYVGAGNHGRPDVKVPDASRQTETSRPHPQWAVACRGPGWPAPCNPYPDECCKMHPIPCKTLSYPKLFSR